MHSLAQALQDHDLIVLRVIGEWWDLDLTGAQKPVCVRELSQALQELDLPQELQFLPPEEAAAIQALVKANGRMPVAAFVRDFGDVRLMGPGRLEREEPWLEPESAAEALWYRGFLHRAFDETAEGMIEFFYLPDELLAQFPKPEKPTPIIKETAVTPLTPLTAVLPLSPGLSDAVDDLTTLLLLAQQKELAPSQVPQQSAFLLNPDKDRLSLLLTLGLEMGLLVLQEQTIRPLATAVAWLQTSREAQLRALAEAWSQSNWNELARTPNLRSEGDQWENDPLLARAALLEQLPQTADWYPIDGLVQTVKSQDPDFQRPDANYDTWYIRDLVSDRYLNGFENWEYVEGRLLRFLIQGPMVWLGLAVTAVYQEQPIYALTDRALEWLADVAPEKQEVNTPLIVQADATILAPISASRLQRFQVGRISDLLPLVPGQPYTYYITPQTLARAQKQGISQERIVSFLEEASQRPLPASLKRGISRWAEKGMEGRLETAVILRVREAAILETLRTNPKTRPFLGESLGDLVVLVPSHHWQSLRTAVAQLGLLLDVQILSP